MQCPGDPDNCQIECTSLSSCEGSILDIYSDDPSQTIILNCLGDNSCNNLTLTVYSQFVENEGLPRIQILTECTIETCFNLKISKIDSNSYEYYKETKIFDKAFFGDYIDLPSFSSSEDDDAFVSTSFVSTSSGQLISVTSSFEDIEVEESGDEKERTTIAVIEETIMIYQRRCG